MDSPVFSHHEKVKASRSGERLDSYLLGFPYEKFLHSLSPSRTTIQKWIENGCVSINGQICTDKSYRVRIDDLVSIETVISPDYETPPPEPLDVKVVYQDRDIIVIDKPPGITSHPVPSIMTGSVVNFLIHEGFSLPPTSHPLRPGIVHRLDKNTSGLMVIAKTDKAIGTLINMMKRREVDRCYLAVVYGSLPQDSGTVDAPVGRHEVMRKKMAVTRPEQGKPARTHYRVLTRYPAFSLVECKLDTGRTHQIRVHMSHIDHPVVGDPLYGGRRAFERLERYISRFPERTTETELISSVLMDIASVVTEDDVHLLHAKCLRFRHPVTGKEMVFRAEPHEKMAKVISMLEQMPHEDTGNAF